MVSYIQSLRCAYDYAMANGLLTLADILSLEHTSTEAVQMLAIHRADFYGVRHKLF